MKRMLFGMLVCLALYAQDYRLGDGLAIGKTGVFAGGYFSLNYWQNDARTRQLTFDDAALMLYGGRAAWRFMAEAELSDAYERRWGVGEGESTDWRVHAERMYLRYEPSETLRLTLGKFNTPYGFWNLMPINVLRDTTSNPRVVETVLPRFTTGGSLRIGSVCSGSTLSLLVQASKDLDHAFNGDDHYNNYDVDAHLGGVYFYEHSRWKMRLNAGAYRERREDETWLYAYGGIRYAARKWTLMAETGYRRDEDAVRSGFGAYIQGAYRFLPKHAGIVRLETVTDYVPDSDDAIVVAGYTYRPLFPVACKLEYQHHERNDESRLLTSFSMLF